MLFLGLQLLGEEHHAFGVKAIGMSMLVVLYFFGVKKKHVLFMLFLLAYSAAEVHNYITYNLLPTADATYDLHYLIGNTLYISAYVFLILRIFSVMNFKKAVSRFPFQIGLLFILGVFVVYLVTDLSNFGMIFDYSHSVELFYNSIIMFLVCLALINYMYNDTKKSMNLLIGSICIIFSEVIQIAYFYVSNHDNALNVLYSCFLVGAFIFFFIQSKLSEEYNPIYERHQELKD
tara:strand:- start:326 stop:1024 length:699 start_codon:yes stop_codon:yes gene_type:complete